MSGVGTSTSGSIPPLSISSCGADSLPMSKSPVTSSPGSVTARASPNCWLDTDTECIASTVYAPGVTDPAALGASHPWTSRHRYSPDTVAPGSSASLPSTIIVVACRPAPELMACGEAVATTLPPCTKNNCGCAPPQNPGNAYSEALVMRDVTLGLPSTTKP